MQKSKRHPILRMAHPGEHLREDTLPALAISKTAFALALGVSRQTLYDLLDEKQGVSAVMAMRLAAVIGGSPELWLNLQMSYDLWKARKEVDVSKLKRLRETSEESVEPTKPKAKTRAKAA